MAKFRINPASLQKAQASLKAWEEKKVRQLTFALQNWALDVVAEIGKEIERIGAIDQGILLAATTTTPVTQQGMKLKITIFNPVEYSVIVEFGRLEGGGTPPLLPIAAWATRHGLTTSIPVNVTFADYPKEWAASGAILRNMGKGGGGKGKKHEMDPITRDLLTVRLIARKIAEQGVAGRHPFTIAWERKIATFKADLSKLVVQ